MRNNFYYSYNPYYRNIPNSFYSYIPRSSRTIASGMNFNSLIQSAQKGINTINQIIPLYKQVKPIYTQARSSLQGLKKYIVPKARTTRGPTYQDNKVYDAPYQETRSQAYTKQNNDQPSSPFFRWKKWCLISTKHHSY